MAQSDCPWLARLHHSFFDATNLYLVMEFYPGGDLQSLLARNDHEFNEVWARFYLAETLQAIGSLHQLGYAHRCLYSRNLISACSQTYIGLLSFQRSEARKHFGLY